MEAFVIEIFALVGLFILSRFLVNVGSKEIAIMERRFFGKELDPGHVFAVGGEVGLKAAYLSPGLHFIIWPIVRVVYKPEERIQKIVAGWPVKFRTPRALALGFKADPDVDSVIRAYIADEGIKVA